MKIFDLHKYPQFIRILIIFYNDPKSFAKYIDAKNRYSMYYPTIKYKLLYVYWLNQKK